jgi:quercetin dioxygenase-like cupin family protein
VAADVHGTASGSRKLGSGRSIRRDIRMGVYRITATEMPHDRSAIDTGGFTATVGEFDAPEGHGDWHHHGDHHLVAYIISGNVTVESGADGNVLTEAGPGDLVHIDPGTVHRETYSGKMKVVGFGIGSGPGVVKVEGPDASSRS